MQLESFRSENHCLEVSHHTNEELLAIYQSRVGHLAKQLLHIDRLLEEGDRTDGGTAPEFKKFWPRRYRDLKTRKEKLSSNFDRTEKLVNDMLNGSICLLSLTIAFLMFPVIH